MNQSWYSGNPNGAVLGAKQRTTDDDWSDYNALKGKLGREPTAQEVQGAGIDPNAPRVQDSMGRASVAAAQQAAKDREAAKAAQAERGSFQGAYNQSHDAYRDSRKSALAGEKDYQNWVSGQTFDEQTGAGASGGRNTASWQDMGRYGYQDVQGYVAPRSYGGPSGEGAVDWNMLGTGGAYEEKERKDAMAARSAWDAAAAGNKSASDYYADRNTDKLERNYGDQREAWTNYTDWDTGQKSEQNRRGMGGSYARPGAMFGDGTIMAGGNSLQAAFQGVPQRAGRGFGGGGVAPGSGSGGVGTQDWVPESARTPGLGGHGMGTSSIRWNR